MGKSQDLNLRICDSKGPEIRYVLDVAWEPIREESMLRFIGELNTLVSVQGRLLKFMMKLEKRKFGPHRGLVMTE